ncbi:endonuclease/exonuclease/phosphatase family protein [Plantactinospora sonchi]|uniref:Endonuclease/exonuclease/phosphatase family protein n=1 Tax=Plantactinospora sonchi TaxID=1544735 RepID=A0ABU7RR08_9ACTN
MRAGVESVRAAAAYRTGQRGDRGAAGMRVMTYNIKNGGRDGGDPGRLDRVLQVVGEVRPDVLAVQELAGLRGDRRRLAAVEDRLSMRAYLAREWFGQPVAVLVRPPAEVVSVAPVRRPFHHAAQRVVLGTDRGPLTVVGTHLHPYSGRRRLREARWLVTATGRGDPDRMVLLMGDLNSLDPWTGHAERLARLAPRYRARHLMPDGATVDTRAVAALHRAGYVDLARQSGQAPADTVPTTGGGGAEFSGMRLDYLLATPALARLAGPVRVVTGGVAESASDHYPLVADLDLRFR